MIKVVPEIDFLKLSEPLFNQCLGALKLLNESKKAECIGVSHHFKVSRDEDSRRQNLFSGQ